MIYYGVSTSHALRPWLWRWGKGRLLHLPCGPNPGECSPTADMGCLVNTCNIQLARRAIQARPSSQDLVVTCPYADAIELHDRPIKVSCPKAKAEQADSKGAGLRSESGLSPQPSVAETQSSGANNEITTHSELTKYIAQHYNPGALPRTHACLQFTRRQCLFR